MIPSNITLKQLNKDIAIKLKAANISEASFEARLLLQECFNFSAVEFLNQQDLIMNHQQCAKAINWAEERAKGVPLAYLSGHRGFYKYDFLVEPGVLIPRPETELVVEVALRRLPEALGQTVADLGCGSGCIGLSLLAERPGLELWAIDADEKAVGVTKKNVERLKLGAAKVELQRVEDWDPPFKFDLIVANPPYIAPDSQAVEWHVRAFEPHMALYADENGLAALKKWSEWSFRKLKDQGILVMEFGEGQAKPLSEILRAQGFKNIEVIRDLNAHERVISGSR